MKKKLYSGFHMLLLGLCFLLPQYTLASTNINTPVQLLKSNNATGTACNTSTCNLDTYTVPTLGINDTIKIYATMKQNTGSSVSSMSIYDTTGANVIMNYVLSTTIQQPADCEIKKTSSAPLYHICRTWASTPVITYNSNISAGDTLALRVVTSASRTFDWSWEVFLIKGANATTTINEESTTTLPWSSITSTPTTLSTYGITDAVLSSRTLTINGTGYDLSADRSWTVSGGSGGTTVNKFPLTHDELQPIVYLVFFWFFIWFFIVVWKFISNLAQKLL